jgi:DNA-binding response OmpR family regulator
MTIRRALICEDDAAIRALVKTVVQREGFAVDVAADGRQGIEKMESGCYDLVVLDLMMPDVDGFAVVDFLKERRPSNLKSVIVMSATGSVVRGDFPEPICKLLPKPFDIDQLTNAVRSCARDCDEDAAAESA